ncbi:MAG: repeat protein [Flavipsychrobacter sp.]|jgi:hypothetical protein|nr:repeat protein [Flavipsychrobacter sp.]
MVPFFRRFFVCICALVPFLASAQEVFYQHDTTVKVFAWGNEQTMAWCGGFNNPQFTMGDLNNDGLKDLVVFEPWNSVRTFINRGSAGNPDYRYAPEFARKFPPAYNYLILADYNCDGVPDLFDQGSTGFEVFRGYYNGHGHLRFNFYQRLFYSNDQYVGGPVNAFNNPGDIPSIVDIDNDGDLDYVAFDISGGRTNLYKDMRVELGLPCDSIHIALKDRCWGRVYQGFYRTHSLGHSCDNTHLLKPAPGAQKVTHSGNTPCLFDWDMDGDYDYLDGSVSFNEMTFLKNGRIENGGGPDSAIAQDTMWQAGGKVIDLPAFPAAFNIDIDQDGKKDLLIAPNAPGSVSENYKGIWFYKNYSTPGTPDWRFQSDSFITSETIDLGAASYPMFFDHNKDGKTDLFVGSDGYYQSGGTLRSRMSYYLNTSTTGSPSYTLQDNDFLGLNTLNFKGVAPATGDIDADNISDLILGHANGTLTYYKNIAGSESVAPNWQLQQLYLTDTNGDTINVGGYAAPFIYDIDKDGKKDLIIGDIYGHIQYYQNISVTPGTINLRLINTRLGSVKVDSPRTFGCYATPFIGKIDSTGIEYMLVGSGSGLVYRFTGFQAGDTAAHYTMLDAQYAYIDTTYSIFAHPAYGAYDGLRSAVAVGDIASDSNYYLVLGNKKGGLELFRRRIYFPVDEKTGVEDIEEHTTILVYPNPASDMVNISWSGVLQPEVRISVMNITGQVLQTATIPSANNRTSLSLAAFQPGMYVCVVQSGVKRYHSKLTVVR